MDDYRWTEVLMREAGHLMDGLSLHNYTIPGNWEGKRQALGFDEAEWFETMKKSLHMDELITRHSAIMDQYDPDKRVGLIVDEWGTWFLTEPGTNPGFLYQQNTMRDALVAGLHLHIFHNHHDRVQMTNIAQMVNVLQAMILTEGPAMLLTPTYHIFEMFKVHQDAQALAVHVKVGDYEYDGDSIPQVSVSASKAQDDNIHISFCNIHPGESANLSLELRGLEEVKKISGVVLASDDMQAHNTFDQPERVKKEAFTSYQLQGQHLDVTLPPMSVVMLTIAP